jgi:hypothetical protein
LGETLYHVLLDGRRLGPYDRRTIVGMRVRKTLTSRHVLESREGERLTVAELLHGKAAAQPEPHVEPPPPSPAPGRASHSVIQATHAADLLAVDGRGYDIPPFQGELELRVQTKVLRLAGRFRSGAGWKEDRVKFPLEDIIHARLQGSSVELGIRPPSGVGVQRLRLDLRSSDAAGELVEGLRYTVPWPGSEPLAGRAVRGVRLPRPLAWAALAGSVAVVAGALAWLLLRA